MPEQKAAGPTKSDTPADVAEFEQGPIGPEPLTNVRGFLAKLFPRELTRYIPGRKLVAGLVLYGLAAGLGVGADQVIELPVVGEVTVEQAALGLGVYLFPEGSEE